ncbi:MAG: hypothetical protein KDI13_11195 [Alphaproteobacteria bacterium]|nr:hypothetical protein [Alphaproteobacteria bacterium]
MTQPELENGEHTESIEGFWQEIEAQFRQHSSAPPIQILSPRQVRSYLLALAGVPKFQYVFDKINAGFLTCAVQPKLLKEHLLEWDGCGLLDRDSLEDEYKNALPPEFMGSRLIRETLLCELETLIKGRVLSARFIKLWDILLRQQYTSLFIENFSPYIATDEPLRENNSSIVERYIYAIWMHEKGYNPKKRNKGDLGTLLSHQIDKILLCHPDRVKKPWQYTHYAALIDTKGKENGLIRTVTDMPTEVIADYATDGLFSKSDFFDLFSET